MSDSAETVGFLVGGEPSAEQRAALEWCETAGIDVAVVSFDEVAAGAGPTGGTDCDVLWWHRGGPVDSVGALPDCRASIREHLEAGGGLLLTLRALEAASMLGSAWSTQRRGGPTESTRSPDTDP